MVQTSSSEDLTAAVHNSYLTIPAGSNFSSDHWKRREDYQNSRTVEYIQQGGQFHPSFWNGMELSHFSVLVFFSLNAKLWNGLCIKRLVIWSIDLHINCPKCIRRSGSDPYGSLQHSPTPYLDLIRGSTSNGKRGDGRRVLSIRDSESFRGPFFRSFFWLNAMLPVWKDL